MQGVSFSLRPGKVTALVGPSGGGKSSCVGLLENFYQPQHGLVLLDGKPVHTLRHDYLHSKVRLGSSRLRPVRETPPASRLRQDMWTVMETISS